MNALRFDKYYNVLTLQKELQCCMQDQWIRHFNQNDYAGKWDCIALRSSDGQAKTIVGFAGSNTYQDTPLLNSLPYMRELIHDMPGVKESVRLMALYPGSEIKPHRDMGCSYAEGYYRIHVPICTHADVEFILDGQPVVMEEGSCWYLDFSKTHQVINRSNQVRVHLVIDGIRDATTDIWFNEHGYIEPEKSDYSRETKLAMLASLEQMDNEGARTLVAKLRKELENA